MPSRAADDRHVGDAEKSKETDIAEGSPRVQFFDPDATARRGGVAMGPEARAKALEAAHEQIGALALPIAA